MYQTHEIGIDKLKTLPSYHFYSQILKKVKLESHFLGRWFFSRSFRWHWDPPSYLHGCSEHSEDLHLQKPLILNIQNHTFLFFSWRPCGIYNGLCSSWKKKNVHIFPDRRNTGAPSTKRLQQQWLEAERRRKKNARWTWDAEVERLLKEAALRCTYEKDLVNRNLGVNS